MDIISIILIAVGLSMDSFAVSIANGLTIRELNAKRILIISFSLSAFQAIMPLIGWFAGIGVGKYVKEIDHWIAFVLLSIIGIRMIYQGVKKNDMETKIKI